MSCGPSLFSPPSSQPEKPGIIWLDETFCPLDERLQHASNLGERLAAVLAMLQQELHDWRGSIAKLQGVNGNAPPTRVPERKLELISPANNGGLESHGLARGDLSHNGVEADEDHDSEDGTAIKETSLELETLDAGADSEAKASTGGAESDAKTYSHVSSMFGSVANTGSPTSLESLCPQLRQLWTEEGQARRKLPSETLAEYGLDSTPLSEMLTFENSYHSAPCCLNRFVTTPNSHRRYILDTLSLIMVTYEITAIPLVIFGYDETYLDLVFTIYWTFDMLASFFDGYHGRNGEVETHCLKTSKRYMKNMFPCDLFIVSADWTLFIIKESGGLASLARISKTARLVRILRVVRVIRAVKFFRLMEKVKNMPLSPQFFSILTIIRLILNLMIINHFLGCGWYAIGKIEASDTERADETWKGTWIDQYLEPTESAFEHYLVSYHWSLAQFTPCPSHIHPGTFWERVYSVLILIFGLVLFATLIGNVTTTINAGGGAHYEQLKAAHDLKEFLTINKVPFDLAARIQEVIAQSRIKKSRVLESDVPSVAGLPSSLRQELHFRIHFPILKRHPLFQLLGSHSQALDTVVHFCHSATQLTILPLATEVFHFRSKAESMFMPMSGILHYMAGGPGRLSRTLLDESFGVNITAGGWLCEASLWLCWENRGRLTVSQQCELAIVDTNRFEKAASLHVSSLETLKRYAALFYQELAKASSRRLVDDLWGSRYGKEIDMLESVMTLQSLLFYSESW